MKKHLWEMTAFCRAAYHDGYVWFGNIYYSALFQLNLETKEISMVKILPGFEGRGFEQHGVIVYNQGMLVIAPLCGGNILVYDIKNDEYEEIEIDHSQYIPQSGKHLFFDFAILGDDIYFLPGKYKAIVKINVKTKEVQYLSDWYEHINSNEESEKGLLFRNCYYQDGMCYLPSWQGNEILIYDLNKGAFEFREVDTCIKGMSSIAWWEGHYWVSDKADNIIYQINLETGESRKFEVEGLQNGSKNGIFRIIPFEGSMYIVPIFGGSIVKMDIEGKCHPCMPLLMSPTKDMEGFITGGGCVMCAEKVENYLLVYSCFDGSVYCYDMKTDTYEVIKAEVDPKRFSEDEKKLLYKSGGWKRDEVRLESDNDDLDTFLDELVKYSD